MKKALTKTDTEFNLLSYQVRLWCHNPYAI